MPPTRDDFEKELGRLLKAAEEYNFREVTITGGGLHRRVGHYPGPDHRMPICCGAMRDAMSESDIELPNDLKKDGASYAIRYSLPR